MAQAINEKENLPEYEFKLNEQDYDVILAALRKFPMEQVEQQVLKLRIQRNSQLEKVKLSKAKE